MTQANEYALIYLLPEPASSYHLDLWAKVEGKFRLTGRSRPKTPPHITLKYSFETNEPVEIEQVLEETTAALSPAAWSIRGYNHFITPGNYVIFLEVVPTPVVRVSHATLLGRLRAFPWMRWDQYDNADMHYHATIAHRGLTDNNFAAAWTFVNTQPPPDFDLRFDNFTLLKIEQEIDKVIRTFSFKAG